MLVQADEIKYDYTNELVSAVGNVQIYYNGATLEADKVVYDQRSKRLHAEGNARLTEADGKITYGEQLDLSDDFRNGFIDSLRLETIDETRMAAVRADRTGANYTVFQSGVYTACEACKDDPLKPPLWQVKAVRIIHDEADKMMYFEDAKDRVFRRAPGVLSLLLRTRPEREAQVRLPDADHHDEFGLRPRHRNAVLSGTGAQLRSDDFAAHHHHPGSAAAHRVPPALRGGQPDVPRLRHRPVGPELLHPQRRHRHPGFPRMARRTRNPGQVRLVAARGPGASTASWFRTRPSFRTTRSYSCSRPAPTRS